METVDELIQIANDSCNFEVLTTSITEKDAQKEGFSNLQRVRTNLAPDQIEVTYRDWRFPVIEHLFDATKGNLSKDGLAFFDGARTVNRDLDFLFCFFSKYDRCPSAFDVILDETMSPVSFFCFVQELFDSFGLLTPEMETERAALSNVVRRVLLGTKRLLHIGSVREMAAEVMRIVDEVNPSVRDSLQPIVEQCFMNAMFTHSVKATDIEKAKDDLLGEICNDMRVLEGMYGDYGTFVHMLTEVHVAVGYMDSDWIYSSRVAPELAEEAKRAVLRRVELAGSLTKGCEYEGSQLMTVTVEWTKKFAKSRLASVAYIEVAYDDSKIILPASKEIVIPVWATEGRLCVKLMYVKKKYAKAKDGIPDKAYGVLCEICTPVRKESSQTVMKFKRRSSVFAGQCGKMTVNLVYHAPGAHVPLSNPMCEYRNPKAGELLDFYAGRLVKAWMQKSPFMGAYPACPEHVALLEFALRYSVPATTVYIAILNKLIQGWCHAEGYLNALTCMFLVTSICLEQCSKNTRETQEMTKITDFLKANVPAFMLQHLSKPALYEKHALLPLFILTCVTVQDDQVDGYLQQIIDRSVKNIIHSVTGFLTPSSSEKEVKQAEALRKYVVTERKSTAPLNNAMVLEHRLRTVKSVMVQEPVKLEQPPGAFIIFEMPTLSVTMECLTKRSRQIEEFYLRSSLPAFVDHWQKLKKEFVELALALIDNFKLVQDQACERDLFRFIINYKILYKFLELPESVSPYVLFTPLILNWISRIGDKMITWVTRSLKYDKFEINVETNRTSTSLVDMIRIFTQSLEFLHVLQWEDKSIEVFVESYLSLCVSCLKMYVDELSIRMLAYFPSDIIRKFNDKLKAFSGHIEDVQRCDVTEVTQESVFVAMNDMFNIRPVWKGFLDGVKAKFPNFEIPDAFANPVVSHVRNICKSVPLLFADWTASETTKGVAPYLWVKNSKLKKFMSKKASKFILNPLFMQKQSNLFNDMFVNTTSFLKRKIDSLNGSICAPYYHMMLAGLFSGLDAGLMNVLVDRPDRKDIIKLKRFMPVMEFIRDVLEDVKAYALEEAEIDTTRDLLDESTPYSQFVFDHMKDDPMKLARADPRAANYMDSLCIYLIVSSHNKNKDAVKWAKENIQLHNTRTFKPASKALQ